MEATIMITTRLLQKGRHELLVIGLGLILASCSSGPYQQTYLTRYALSDITKISVHTSASELEVKYAISTSMGTAPVTTMLLSPLLVFPAAGIEAAIKANKDKGTAGEIGNQVDLHEIEEEMSQVFIMALSNGNPLRNTMYICNKDDDEHK